MKHVFATIVSTCLLLLSFPNARAADGVPVCYWQLTDEARYIYPDNLDHYHWRRIRQMRRAYTTAGQALKVFELCVAGPDGDLTGSRTADLRFTIPTIPLVRDPDGVTTAVPSLSEAGSRVSIPRDPDLIGRYLLGVHICLNPRDVDGDGREESVYLCAKQLVSHYKNGGRVGAASVVFFDDAEKMPFELGPVINTAKSKYGGGTQQPHQVYEMMVRYRNQPLAGVQVDVTAGGSQWRKTFVTDSGGIFEIMPTDDRLVAGEWQKYLYVATHHDRERRAYYVATLPVVVYKNRPEWRSKAMGFTYWAIIGSVTGLLMIAGFIRRKHRLARQALVIFENHKIKGDRS